MRVGVIGPTRPDDFADNILHCLPDLGVTAIPLGPAVWRSDQWLVDRAVGAVRQAGGTPDGRFQRSLVRRAAEHALEVVISVDGALLPETVAALRRHGARTCLWFPDPVSNLQRFPFFHAPYDAMFFKDPLLAARLHRVLGLPVHYLPEACNPAWHRPPAEPEPEPGSEPEPDAGSDAGSEPDSTGGAASGRGPRPHIAVAGNMYATRQILISRLLDAGIPVRVYGPPLPRRVADPRLRAAFAGRYVSRHEKARVYRTAAGVLNNMQPSEMHSVNCRLFEAAGCGAAVLCESRPVLADLFELDREVFAFADFDELVERARKLLSDADLARSTGDAAAARAHRDHTYQHRLATLLERVA